MPCLDICHYLAIVLEIIMPQANQSAKPPYPANGALSVFLIISAKAYSSVGFGLSVLAIWVRWLLPGALGVSATTQVIPITPPKPRSKLRSLPKLTRIPPPTLNMRRSTSPTPHISQPILRLEYNPDYDSSSHRRVYFADTKRPPPRRSTTPEESTTNELRSSPDPTPPTIPELFFSPLLTESPPSTADSTTSTLTMMIQEPHNEAILDMENEKPPTTPISTPRQHKLKLGFTLKHKRTTSDKSREESGRQVEDVLKPSKKANHNFVYSWGISRKATPSLESPANSEAGPSKPTCSILSFHRPSLTTTKSSSSSSSVGSVPSVKPDKKARRISAPVARTSPYEAPYFATPPLLLDDSYSTYLRRLPRFEDDMSSHPPSDSAQTVSGRRPSSSDGIVNGSQRPVVKRRSASVNWTPRKSIGVVH